MRHLEGRRTDSKVPSIPIHRRGVKRLSRGSGGDRASHPNTPFTAAHIVERVREELEEHRVMRLEYLLGALYRRRLAMAQGRVEAKVL